MKGIVEVRERYRECLAEQMSLKDKILALSPVKSGDLIRDNLDKKHYRVKYVCVEDDGRLSISVRDIKNYRVNWESCSTPEYTCDNFNFEVVSWEFNHDQVSDLEDELGNTDSISRKEDLVQKMHNLFLSCHHEWKACLHGDGYECKHCHSSTEREQTNDWLNGSKEQHNICLDHYE